MTVLHKQLASCARECRQMGAGYWRLALGDGLSLIASARQNEGFLLLNCYTGVKVERDQLVSLVEGAMGFPATVKFVLSGSGSAVRVHAEFPLSEDFEAGVERIREHLSGVEIASHWLHMWASCPAATEGMALSERHTGQQAAANTLTPAPRCALADLLKEAGWPYRERAGGGLLADLETGKRFHQAEIDRCGSGTRFWVTFCRNDAFSDTAQQALCLYLLEANGALRYGRAFIERKANVISAGFEVRIESAPSATEAGHALAALSVACRQCAKETGMFTDDTLVGIYLSARPPFYQHNSYHQSEGA
jgi:hypothetical protein